MNLNFDFIVSIDEDKGHQKNKNKFVSRYLPNYPYWKRRYGLCEVVIQYNKKRLGWFSWYRYWLQMTSFSFFFNKISKNFLFGLNPTFLSTNVDHFCTVKYYCEKMNCFYIVGFNKSLMTRFIYWQLIYSHLDYGYKFSIPIMTSFLTTVEGDYLHDIKYINYFKNRLTYIVGLTYKEWDEANGYDLQHPFITPNHIHFYLGVILNNLFKKWHFLNQVEPAKNDDEVQAALDSFRKFWKRQ